MQDLTFYLANTPTLQVDVDILLQTDRSWFDTGLPSLLSSSRNSNTFGQVQLT